MISHQDDENSFNHTKDLYKYIDRLGRANQGPSSLGMGRRGGFYEKRQGRYACYY